MDYKSNFKNLVTFEKNKGNFIKPCPGTPAHVCCGYKIIDFAHGCTLGCSYCILKYYFKNKPITVFTNRKKLFKELEEYINKEDSIVRFGTGEFTDSLLFEDIQPFYKDLVPFISKYKNTILEIKTKTINIKSLKKIKDHWNTMVSWSVNTPTIIRNEEKGAPGIQDRINAAEELQKEGYKLGFHFDPLIIYPGWKEEYRRVVDMIFEKIKPENIVYVSMGALRFISEMKEMLENARSFYVTGEFIKGLDNKLRYFRPIRVRLYMDVKLFLLDYIDISRIYLCMESPQVWEEVFSIKGMNTKKLTERLAICCKKSFKLIEKTKK